MKEPWITVLNFPNHSDYTIITELMRIELKMAMPHILDIVCIYVKYVMYATNYKLSALNFEL
jgi:hypothetical protein